MHEPETMEFTHRKILLWEEKLKTVNAITTSERNHTPQGFKRKFHNNAPRNINNT
jgi:hypothetical protein